jgi:hypothetical protein
LFYERSVVCDFNRMFLSRTIFNVKREFLKNWE